MKDHKAVVPLLLVIAISIWGWNFWSLFQGNEDLPIISETLPDLPKDLLEEVFAHELPELKRDPFVEGAPAQAAPPTVVRQPQPPAVKPPQATLILITLDGEQARALVVLQDGSERTLQKGEVLDTWTVAEIDMERVLLTHEKAPEHQLRIRQ